MAPLPHQFNECNSTAPKERKELFIQDLLLKLRKEKSRKELFIKKIMKSTQDVPRTKILNGPQLLRQSKSCLVLPLPHQFNKWLNNNIKIPFTVPTPQF